MRALPLLNHLKFFTYNISKKISHDFTHVILILFAFEKIYLRLFIPNCTQNHVIIPVMSYHDIHYVSHKLLVVFINHLSNRPQVSMVYRLINHAGCW